MNNKLNVLIIEDELLIAEMLKEMLIELNCTIIAIAQNYDQAIHALEKNQNINFIFLDINLNSKKNGFNIAEILNQQFQIPFLFLTSYSDVATIQNAAKFKPQSYLNKPFTKSELVVILELFKVKNTIVEKFIEFKDGHFNLKVNQNDIFWIKSENNYLEIKTIKKTYVIRNSLEKFLVSLDNENFVRIHRSYLANIQYIQAVNRIHVIIQNTKIPISRKYHKEISDRFLMNS